MTRGGRSDDRDASERRCIATGEAQPKRGLIRFAVSPEGRIVPDLLERLPGRGIWVAAERSAIELAVSRRLFARAAKGPVEAAEDLPDQVEQALVRRVVERIAMARKAGRAVAGYEKVKGWLDTGQAAILLQAHDGSERGRSKLRPPGGRGTFFDTLNARELGLSFGRENVIHAALAAGRLSERFRDDAVRLAGVRATSGGTPTGKARKTT